MNLEPGYTAVLQKEGTIEQRPYTDDMTIFYVLNADCETLIVDVTFMEIEAAESTVYDELTIGGQTFNGFRSDVPFQVKLTPRFLLGDSRVKCF